MSILFINGSPNQKGTTAQLAATLLEGKPYETVNLVDYKVYSYGQKFEDDQFDLILSKMKEADTIVLGSPVYWHNMCGAVRNLLDRFYGPVKQGALSGKKLVFIFQGGAPQPWMFEKSEYSIIRFAKLYGLEYLGMVSTQGEAKQLAAKL